MKSLFNDVKHDMAKEDPDMLAPTIAQLEGMHDLDKGVLSLYELKGCFFFVLFIKFEIIIGPLVLNLAIGSGIFKNDIIA
uniref:Uncharacterized protein n=1 Tax=Aegilops tauschii TaxID=37682 RepID=M8CCA6_AEGTA